MLFLALSTCLLTFYSFFNEQGFGFDSFSGAYFYFYFLRPFQDQNN